MLYCIKYVLTINIEKLTLIEWATARKWSLPLNNIIHNNELAIMNIAWNRKKKHQQRPCTKLVNDDQRQFPPAPRSREEKIPCATRSAWKSAALAPRLAARSGEPLQLYFVRSGLLLGRWRALLVTLYKVDATNLPDIGLTFDGWRMCFLHRDCLM